MEKLFIKILFILFILSSTLINAITLTLNGNNPEFVIHTTNYIDAGATSTSTETINIRTTNNVNTDIFGRYEVIYTASDTENNIEIATRTVYIISEKKLDIDNDGQIRANSDGIIIFRYFNGLNGENLIRNALNKNAALDNATAVIAYLNLIAATKIFDIDASGQADNKDGKLILKYLVGFRGDSLTRGLNLTGTRTLEASITDYFKNILTPPSWRKATDAAQWSARFRHSSVVFNEQMWVLGGNDMGDNQNDVWSSTDGINWASHTAPAGNSRWTERSEHSSVAFQKQMWVFGGNPTSNDIWASADGASWTRLLDSDFSTSDRWSHRNSNNSIVFKNKMWVLGGIRFGFPNTYYNDVWSSTNGTTWTQAEITSAASWSARAFHSSVVFNDKIWVLGGFDGSNRLNDVWFTDNASATIWTKATATTPKWSARIYLRSVVWRDKIWVFGGQNSDSERLNDVWSSADGVHWQQHANAPWSKRRQYSAVVFNNKIWLFGGDDGSNNGNGINDVWSFGN